jgi:hypothetical protein
VMLDCVSRLRVLASNETADLAQCPIKSHVDVGSIPRVQRSPMNVTYSAGVRVASTPVRDVFCVCAIQAVAAPGGGIGAFDAQSTWATSVHSAVDLTDALSWGDGRTDAR